MYAEGTPGHNEEMGPRAKARRAESCPGPLVLNSGAQNSPRQSGNASLPPELQIKKTSVKQDSR